MPATVDLIDLQTRAPAFVRDFSSEVNGTGSHLTQWTGGQQYWDTDLSDGFTATPKFRPPRFLMVAHARPSLLSGATMQHFPEIQLTSQEARVFGCLLEKEILTPDSYPLTHNSLLLACNQTSSRDPITRFTGEEVAEALRGLSEKYLVEKILGGRTPKFEHCLQNVLSLQPGERAVLTVLLLRGPQSAGEIRQRTERLHTFASLEEVEETLTWFIEYPHGPLVRRIPVGEGRRVESFAHLLSSGIADTPSVTDARHAASDTAADDDWRAAIEARLATLESQIVVLKARQMP